MIRHSLRGTHTQVAIVEDQINSMGDRANCQKGDYPNLTLGDDGGRSSRGKVKQLLNWEVSLILIYSTDCGNQNSHNRLF